MKREILYNHSNNLYNIFHQSINMSKKILTKWKFYFQKNFLNFHCLNSVCRTVFKIKLKFWEELDKIFQNANTFLLKINKLLIIFSEKQNSCTVSRNEKHFVITK
jgi:hypothetical protein